MSLLMAVNPAKIRAFEISIRTTITKVRNGRLEWRIHQPLCRAWEKEAFLHAYTGQPLPTDEDLRKDRPDDIPAEAKRLMTEMGIEFESYDE